MIERPTNALRPHVAAMTQDIRYAWRSIRRSPGFTAIAVAMLALGTGANTALFSVVEGVMLRSPFDRPDAIAWVSAREAGGRTTMAVSRDAYDRLGRLPLFDAVALVGIGSPVATGIDAPRRLLVECVPASMIDVLGARPHLGRWFSAAEDRPVGPPVVVVSFRFWRRDLRGDPDVLGRTIALDGEPASIVGVMRSGFDGV
ncbi:MAG TPA: ABC transporter permease, partial [Longimicrobiales bacterium]|nr:ABC transporter permease [Longimicrobiales bacterium]